MEPRLVAWCAVALLSSPSPASAAPATDSTTQPTQPRAAVAGCKLFEAGASEAPSSACTGCHSTGHGAAVMGSSHPVEVEYGVAQARRRGALRDGAEVARRGLRLPNGKVECVTCHDAASPWAKHIALPRGAPAIARTDPERRVSWRLADPKTPPPPAGSEVVSAPLCAACHTAAD